MTMIISVTCRTIKDEQTTTIVFYYPAMISSGICAMDNIMHHHLNFIVFITTFTVYHRCQPSQGSNHIQSCMSRGYQNDDKNFYSVLLLNQRRKKTQFTKAYYYLIQTVNILFRRDD